MSWFSNFLCKVFHIGCPVVPPSPPGGGISPSRPGLTYCYYGVQDGDIPQIKDHVNAVMMGSWGDWVSWVGRADLVNRIVGYGHEAVAAGVTKLIFTLDFCLYTQTNPRQLLPEATAIGYLIALCDRLRDEGLMQYVLGWYPIDEPNIHEIGLSADQIFTANTWVRNVTCHYTDTGDPSKALPLMVIYGQSGGSYPGIQSYDWCGFDNYGAPIFTNGEYNHLVSQLNATQKTLIVPGGSDPWREDPVPFYNKAQSDTRVAMIMPFKWFGSDGIGANGMAPQYKAVGLPIKVANP